jgi:hypothetical protein
MLLAKGADKDAINFQKKRPADVAYDEGYSDLVEILGGTTPGFCGCTVQ